MKREEMISKLGDIMVNQLELVLAGPLSEADRLNEDLHIDSIMVLQLIVYMEEVFQVSVPEEEIDPSNLQTVGSLVRFVDNLQAC
ncbi:MAG: hypothetical protein K0R57_605 [Paenibacillaceae bacterium]|jgi:acyl carrier protein|nr:hypothetical protein [Paenibacillaceae bacterium]